MSRARAIQFYGVPCHRDLARGLTVLYPWTQDRGTRVVNHGAKDRSTAYNGTLVGTPNIIGTGIGVPAFSNDGSVRYVSLAQPSVDSEGTIACWASPQGTHVGTGIVFGSYGGTGNRRSPSMYFNGTSSGNILWDFGADITNSTGIAWTLRQWYHLCIVWHEADNYIRAYVDGILRDSAAWSDPGGALNTVEHLGHYNGFGTNYLNGWIGPYTVWSRALSHAEVWRQYAPATRWELFGRPRRRAGRAPDAPPVGGHAGPLVNAWPLKSKLKGLAA